jgi:2-succinyl-5-enolpyruvyl-6-hydroxy-3-cyclohexene-1-carboxylate synthase
VIVSAFDAILRSLGESLRPEVVLRLGEMPASRVLAEWLAGFGGDEIVADPYGAWIDPGRSASLLVAGSDLCRSLVGDGPAPAPDGWAAAWRSAEATAQQTIATVLSEHPEVTEPAVARAVTATVPADGVLLAASSMPVRDVEWFGDPAMTCRVVANRGANGIDGTVSTALGVAAGTAGRVVALLGDLAFLHDSGGLLGAARRDLACTFVVVDNDGGGIFSFLPQAGLARERFELLWGTPHGVDLGALAAVHGVPVTVVGAAEEVGPAVAAGIRDGGVRLVLARTDRAENVAVHNELNAAVAAALRT